ncbi:MAG: trypsin-like serine protease [Pseudorhodoplanes sp.]|jgi:secreted trypsin-like serine protease|nr:trypsin-like serine protease [Pseudorhodoplanes sp.]
MTRRLLAPILLVSLNVPAAAMVGGAAPVNGAHAAVTIVGSRGNFCTGAYIARDLVLTAAHCVLPGADYKLVAYDAQRQPSLRDTARIERHPQFNLDNYNKARVTADVALIKLPAPANVTPVPLSGARLNVQPGDRFIVSGLGVAIRGDGKSGGTLRQATLAATGKPGNLQIRLMDPATRNERSGLGACTGDSGAPVFQENGGRYVVIGVVSWSTGPRNTDGCGGLTGVTPLQLYYPWIAETAKKLGSPLP